MLAVELAGGLGNQLFQLAATDTIASETGRTPCILTPVSPKTPHADANYFDSVLSAWKDYPRLPSPYVSVGERSFAKTDWSGILLRDVPVCLNGYFQNWRYVPPDFTKRLGFPSVAALPGAFLHIRGGDYVNHSFHDVGLYRGYYSRAVEQFPPGTHFYVFTNDIGYAKQMGFLSKVPHTFVTSDEVTSLAQMAACTEGGICANSSFSWWGAYLNPNRTIVMPNKWYNDNTMVIEGYYFPGVRKCQV